VLRPTAPDHRQSDQARQSPKPGAVRLRRPTDGAADLLGLAVAVGVDPRVDLGAHVEVDLELRGQLGGAVGQTVGVDEFAVAEDGAALVLAVRAAFLVNGRLAAVPLDGLAIDLAARLRGGRAGAVAGRDALGLAGHGLVVVVAAVLALAIAGLGTGVATTSGVFRIRALVIAVRKARVATHLLRALRAGRGALLDANGRAVLRALRGRRRGTLRIARLVKTGRARLFDGDDLAMVLALLRSPELALRVPAQKDATTAFQCRLGDGRRGERRQK